MSSQKTFQESWVFASEIKDEVGACMYDIAQYPGTFRSGRPRWMCTYYDVNRKVVARRIGMSLTSKKGVEYKVFSREEWVDRPQREYIPRTILRREQSSDYDALTILNEAYAADQASE